MIAYLQGRVIYRDLEKSIIILETNGIGYEVHIPVSNNNSSCGHYTSLFIHTYVREDRITLYGFNTTLQREIFGMLLDVKDVGPKLAVTILSSIDSANFVNIVTAQDASALSQIKGIGSAKAERIIMELKNKVLKKIALFNDINARDLYIEENINSDANKRNNSTHSSKKDNKQSDASDENLSKDFLDKSFKQPSDVIFESAGALEALGYSKLDSFSLAGKVFGVLKTQGNMPASTEDLMRECLKYIYSRRNL